MDAGLLVHLMAALNNGRARALAAQPDASWTISIVFRRFRRRTRRGLVIAFPIRKCLLALAHIEFAETRDVFDCVEAPSDAIAPRWGNRSPCLAPGKPVGRKTKLTGCFGDT